jgi:hypothetical protein
MVDGWRRGKYGALASEIGASGAQVLTVPDKEWLELNKRYDAFNMLVKLPGAGVAVNWDFSSGSDGRGLVDKIAALLQTRWERRSFLWRFNIRHVR